MSPHGVRPRTYAVPVRGRPTSAPRRNDRLARPDDAESVTERVATKRNRLGPLCSELVLDGSALASHFREYRIQVGHVEVEMHGRPMSFVAAELGARGRALRTRRLRMHAH